jgi:DNA-binding NarL/FixJ family response regulator
MANVIVATSQPVELHALCDIAQSAGHKLVGKAVTGQQALRLVRELQPDLLIASPDLPKVSGFEVLRRLKVQALPTRIILFGAETASHFVERCFHAGADGFVGKQEDEKELRRAIAAVLSGHRYFPNQDRPVHSGDTNNPLSTLSEREFSVFRYLVQGHSNSSIANELSISPKTVSTHRGNLSRKLDACSLLDLVEVAKQYGVLPGSGTQEAEVSDMSATPDADVAMMRAMLDGTPLPLHVRDMEGRLIACNDAYLTLNKTTLEDAIGTRLTDMDWLPAGAAQAMHDKYLAHVMAGKPASGDREITRHGKRVILHTWATPYHGPDGRMIGMVCGSLDVTGREDVLKALAIERDAADVVRAALSRLLSALADELEPLAALLREVQASQQASRTHSADGLASRSGAAVQRLERLSRGVRELVRLDQGESHLSFDRVEPEALTREVVEAVQAEVFASRSAISLSVSGVADMPVILDRERYTQLLWLLMRRVLVQPYPLTVDVRLNVAERGGDACMLTVEVESSPEKRSAAHAAAIVEAGSDLVLLLGDRLVQLMHGTLRSANSAAGSTRVILRLPAPRA